MKVKKYVVNCSGFEIRQMKEAGKAVLKLSGVTDMHVQVEDRMLTVIGTVDLSDVLSKLKRIGKKNGHAELVSLDPNYDEEIEVRKRKRNKISKILSNCGKCIVSVVTCVAVGFPISGAV